jgi:hypothetical protein
VNEIDLKALWDRTGRRNFRAGRVTVRALITEIFRLQGRVDSLTDQVAGRDAQIARVRAVADQLDADAAQAWDLHQSLIGQIEDAGKDWHPLKNPQIPRLESIAQGHRATARKLREALDGEPESKETGDA